MKDEQLIKNIILEGEHEQLDFKESVQKENIAKVICSFLNGKGGRVIIGLNNSGTIKGISNALKVVEDLKVYLLNSIIPEAPITINVESLGRSELIMIKVYGGSKQPYIFDGNIYYRKGLNTQKATSKEISKLIHGRQNSELHWERQITIGVTVNDLDQKLIQSTIRESRENHRSSFQGDDVLDFLANYSLYQNGSFTNACVVLFGKQPARFFPQIRVRLTEYVDGKTDNQLLRDELLEGNLFLIQSKLEKYIGNLGIRSVFEKNQWKRVDFKFPEKALQEGIINALMHRDYSSVSSGVSISIYPDSVVISNSGHLPDDLTVRLLKTSHRSHPVNPDIAHIVFLRGLIDKLGRGTLKVLEECEKEGLKKPIWKDNDDGVSLTFYGPRALASKRGNTPIGLDNGLNDGLNDGVNDGVIRGVSKLVNDGVDDGVIDGVTDGVIVEVARLTKLISQKEGMNTLDIATKRGKSKPTVERYLRTAREVGIIEFRGAPRTGGYYLSNKIKNLI